MTNRSEEIAILGRKPEYMYIWRMMYKYQGKCALIGKIPNIIVGKKSSDNEKTVLILNTPDFDSKNLPILSKEEFKLNRITDSGQRYFIDTLYSLSNLEIVTVLYDESVPFSSNSRAIVFCKENKFSMLDKDEETFERECDPSDEISKNFDVWLDIFRLYREIESVGDLCRDSIVAKELVRVFEKFDENSTTDGEFKNRSESMLFEIFKMHRKFSGLDDVMNRSLMCSKCVLDVPLDRKKHLFLNYVIKHVENCVKSKYSEFVDKLRTVV